MTRNTSVECGGCGSRNVTYTAEQGFRCEDCGQHEGRAHVFLPALDGAA